MMTGASLDGKLIIALGRSYRRAQERSMVLCRKNGLTLPQFTVLEILYHRGDLTIQQIIDKAVFTSGTMTVIIRNLVRNGFVYKTENPKDKRSFIISLTKRGRDVTNIVFQEHMKNLSEAFSKLKNEEKTNVINILKKLR